MNNLISLLQPVLQQIKICSYMHLLLQDKITEATSYMDSPEVTMMLSTDQKHELLWLLRECGKFSSYQFCEGGDSKM